MRFLPRSGLAAQGTRVPRATAILQWVYVGRVVVAGVVFLAPATRMYQASFRLLPRSKAAVLVKKSDQVRPATVICTSCV